MQQFNSLTKELKDPAYLPGEDLICSTESTVLFGPLTGHVDDDLKLMHRVSESVIPLDSAVGRRSENMPIEHVDSDYTGEHCYTHIPVTKREETIKLMEEELLRYLKICDYLGKYVEVSALPNKSNIREYYCCLMNNIAQCIDILYTDHVGLEMMSDDDLTSDVIDLMILEKLNEPPDQKGDSYIRYLNSRVSSLSRQVTLPGEKVEENVTLTTLEDLELNIMHFNIERDDRRVDDVVPQGREEAYYFHDVTPSRMLMDFVGVIYDFGRNFFQNRRVLHAEQRALSQQPRLNNVYVLHHGEILDVEFEDFVIPQSRGSDFIMPINSYAERVYDASEYVFHTADHIPARWLEFDSIEQMELFFFQQHAIRLYFVHQEMTRIRLMHDIETNPGPQSCGGYCDRLFKLTYNKLVKTAIVEDDMTKQFIIKCRAKIIQHKLNRSCQCDNFELLLMLLENLEVQPQMLSSMNPFSNFSLPSISVDKESLKETEEILKSVVSDVKVGLKDDTKEFLSALAQSINVNHSFDIASIGDYFKHIFDSEHILIYLGVFSAICLVCRERNPSFTNIALLFLVGAAVYCKGPQLYSLIANCLSTVTPQAFDEWPSFICELIGFTVFSSSLSFDSIRKMNVGEMARQFRDSVTAMTSVRTYIDMAKDLIFKLIRLVGEAIGKEWNFSFSPYTERLNKLQKRLALIKVSPSMNGEMTSGFVDDVKRLQFDILQFYSEIEVKKDSVPYTSALNNMLHMLAAPLDIIKSSVFAGKTRVEPATEFINGQSGVGKSFVQNLLAEDAFEKFATPDEKKACEGEFNRKVYVHPIGSKHYDYYSNQYGAQFNDWLQKKETVGSEVSSVETLIQMIGNQVCKLPAAVATKKGTLMFSSRAIHVNTNVRAITDIHCATCQDAVPMIRRANGSNGGGTAVRLAVHERYGKDVPDNKTYPVAPLGKPENYFRLTLDISKVPEKRNEYGDKVINTDVYEFWLWDYGTGNMVPGSLPMTYHQYIAYRDRVWIGHYARQEEAIKNRNLAALRRKERDKLLVTPQGVEDSKFEESKDISISIDETYFPPGSLTDAAEYISGSFCTVKGDSYNIHNTIREYIKANPPGAVYDTLGEHPDDPQEFPNTLNFTQRISIRDLTYENLCSLSVTKYSDRAIEYMYLLREKGYTFLQSFQTVAFSVFDSICLTLDNLSKDAYKWFDNHPILATLLHASAGVAVGCIVYKVVTMFCSFLPNFIPKLSNAPGMELVQNGWINQNTKQLEPLVGKDGLVSEWDWIVGDGKWRDWDGSILENKDPNMLHRRQAYINSVSPQSSEVADDKRWRFMRARLSNFFRLVMRVVKLDTFGFEAYETLSAQIAIGVCGHCYSTNYHMYRNFELRAHETGVVRVDIGLIPVDSNLMLPEKWWNYKSLPWIFRDEDIKKDRCIFKIPRDNPMVGDLRDYMPSIKSSYYELLKKGNKLPIMVWRCVDGKAFNIPCNLVYTERICYELPCTSLNPHNKHVLSPHTIEMEGATLDLPTLPGDCSMPAFMWSKSLSAYVSQDDVLQHPFTCYQHVGFHNKLSLGVGSFLWREDFYWLNDEFLGPKKQSVLDSVESGVSNTIKIVGDVLQQSKPYPGFVLDIDGSPPIAEHHGFVGMTYPQKTNRSNNIVRSEVYNPIVASYGVTSPISKKKRLHKYPTCLIPKDGKDPLLVGVHKYGSGLETCIDPRDTEMVANFIATKYMNTTTPVTDFDREQIDVKVAIRGDPVRRLRGLNRKSAVGVQLGEAERFYGLPPGTFKDCFGIDGDYDFSTPGAKAFVALVEDAAARCRKGEVPLNIYKNHLKVECKDEGCRIFCGSDKFIISLCNVFFGGFASHVTANRIKSGIAIGINPATEWEMLMISLRRVSDLGLFGDFGWFDKLQISELMFITFETIRMFYGDYDPEGNRAREALFELFLETIHLLGLDEQTCIYTWRHGNTSGNLLTAIINSFSNIGILYHVGLYILRRNIKFKSLNTMQMLEYIDKNVSYCMYGDDNVIMMSEDIRQYINFYNFSDGVARVFHMKYTDECKGKRIGYTIPNHTSIFDGSFLGRGFGLVDGHVTAPLRMVSIVEPLAWYKGKTRDPSELLANFERANKELSAYGRKHFDIHAPRLANICYRAIGSYPKFANFDVAFAAYKQMEHPEYDFYGYSDSQDCCGL